MANNPPPPAQTPRAVAGEVYLPGPDWTLFRSLPNFDLRNGDPSDVTSVLIKATIPAARHWVSIGGLVPEDGTKAMDGFIKSHLLMVNAARGADMTVVQARKIGIVLGVARAVMTTYFRLTDQDITAGERAAPVLNAYLAENGEMLYKPVADLGAALVAQLNEPLIFSDVERAAICALVKCGMGIIPMQGYSLLMTGHHYLSQADSQARKIYAVAEKAYWRSTDVGTWFTDDLGIIQDALWHKAGHPVLMSIKEQVSMDINIATKLKASGAGACASRLPAAESELRAANSYMSLLSTVAPMFEMFGGAMNAGFLGNLAEFVKSLPVNVANPTIAPAVRDSYDGLINNRDSGLRYLDAVLRRNQDRVAFCYGFYMAQAESEQAMGVGASANDDTLRTSNSLKKLKNQSYAAFNAGKAAYGDYNAVRNKRRLEGVFDAPNVNIL